jgi:hypothetical protein
MKMKPRRSRLAALFPILLGAGLGSGLIAGGAPAFAEEDDDTSTDLLGEQKGSDRVDDKDAKVDRSNANTFEKERFFIDKIDTADTEEKTLFQGNLVSSSFFYTESGGKLTMGDAPGGTTSNSQFSRMFTDLRLQLDARHIRGGRWLARVDVRGRGVIDPAEKTGYNGDSDTRIQSGLTGESELEARELWVARPGDRYDVFIGRQFVADLGAVKIDGVRIDYAKSDRVTLLGFAGAYPLRGSRSIGTDYPVQKDNAGTELGRTPPIAAGAGAAYRTPLSYGSLGGGVIAPIKGAETPRVFVTSTGYLRTGPKLDVYHFGLIDLVGEGGFSINNLSAGVNYRLGSSLRATASVNHVDTETLQVQARTFLEPTDANVARNDVTVRRISSTAVQGGLSASLGRRQQIEASVQVAGRVRPDLTVPAGGTGGAAGTPTTYALKGASSIDVWGQLVHRDLFRSRIGVDGIRSYLVSDTSARSSFYSFRLFLSREFRQGRGTWEGEASYSATKDEVANDQTLAYGKAKTSTLAASGNLFYRLKTSWFVMGSLGVGRFSVESIGRTLPMMAITKLTDPTVTSISAFLRLAYRF